jgi:hypothetical protein
MKKLYTNYLQADDKGVRIKEFCSNCLKPVNKEYNDLCDESPTYKLMGVYVEEDVKELFKIISDVCSVAQCNIICDKLNIYNFKELEKELQDD